MKKTLYNIFKKCSILKAYNNIILVESTYINKKNNSIICIITSKKMLLKNEILNIKENIKNKYQFSDFSIKLKYNSNIFFDFTTIKYFIDKIIFKYKIYLSKNWNICNEIIYIYIDNITLIENIKNNILKDISIFITKTLSIQNDIILIYNNIQFKYLKKYNSIIYTNINNFLLKKNYKKVIINIKCKIFKIEKKLYNNIIINLIYVFDSNSSIKIITIINNSHLDDVLIMQKYYVINYHILYSIFNIYYISNLISINEFHSSKFHRIELHAHSNMSAMDGVSSIKNLIETAKKLGQKAIAITDHGVVQSFPEAINIAKKYNMKIIFGTEGYVFDNYTKNINDIFIVLNSKKYSFDSNFIILDIIHHNQENIFELNLYKISSEKLNFEKNKIIIENKNCDIKKYISIIKESINKSVIISINAEEHERFLYEICHEHFTVINLIELSKFFINQKITYNLSNIYKFFFTDVLKEKNENHIYKIYKIFYKCIDIIKQKFNINNIYDINLVLIDKEKLRNYKYYHIIIIAKNKIGIKNLYKLISESHINYFYKKPRIPKSLLEKYRNGLIIGSACEAGEVFVNVVKQIDDQKLEKIIKFYDYLEIQPIINNEFLVKSNKIDNINILMEYNKKIFNMGKRFNKPVVATGDVHYAKKDEYIYRNILMFGMGYVNIPKKPYLYLKSTDEMINEFSYLGKKNSLDVVINNTNYIASLCEDNLCPIPEKLYTPILPKSLLSLEILVNKKYKKLYGKKINDIINKRFNKEMSTILEHKFDVMYIISYELIKKSNQNGYLVGSRGSVGSSFIAYLLSITEVNPLPAHYICRKCNNVLFVEGYDIGIDLPDLICENCNIKLDKNGYNIPFEVFLGFNGEKAPDIDLNFSGEYQLRAHQHVADLFGKENIFRAGTINTIAKRTAYGFVKKYIEETQEKFNKFEEEKLIDGCTGIKRTTGQHPGGIMILPRNKSIYDICPIQHPADSSDTNIVTTHFDYNAIHNNLLKLDLLGHDDPTMLKYLQDITSIDVLKIPLDDKKTMNLFISTNELGFNNDLIIGNIGTIAIPEFGTKFVRDMLKDTQPTTFSELIKISGLSHGSDVWLYNAQDLIKKNNISLKDVICVRDDIMNYLMTKKVDKKIAFEIMESVRKGKGLIPEWEIIMKNHEIPNWYINSCKKIKYIFPKAHASAYVIMAFRIAWFKLYFPLQFYSAYFSIRAKNFDAFSMTNGINDIQDKIKNFNSNMQLTNLEKETFTTLEVCYEFYKRGFLFKKVDIHLSDLDKFIILKEGFLVPPLTSIIGLGKTAALNIIAERNKNKFTSKENFIKRCSKISKNIIKIFEDMNILEQLPSSSQISLF